MKHIHKTNYFGTPNIGMYLFATDSYAIVGAAMEQKEKDMIESILKVPVYSINICGTPMAGLFLAGDEKTLFVPELIYTHEFNALEQIEGVTVVKVPSRFTALGNNMVVGNGAIFVNSELEPEAIEFLSQYGVVDKIEVADTDVVGSCVALNKKGGVVHPGAEDEELDVLEEKLGVPLTKATVNMGSNYVKSGIVANSNGFIVGNSSTGPEVANIDEALGFLE
jgi:translation initiation factor 6